MNRSITILVATGVMVVYARVLAGCFETPKEIGAASAYEAQQLRCVDQYATKVDIDACRAKVRAAWDTTDGGHEGGVR
jgi:outer membrane murein-binding lipoprotein Lpp